MRELEYQKEYRRQLKFTECRKTSWFITTGKETPPPPHTHTLHYKGLLDASGKNKVLAPYPENEQL